MHETFGPLAQVRQERFRALVESLKPRIRRVSPTLNDAELLAAAELMAQYRLADEELAKNPS